MHGTASDSAPAAGPGPMAVPPGYRVAGWEVTRAIGAGNWGSVYAARRVAEPEPHPDPTAEPLPDPDPEPEPEPEDRPAEAALKFLITAHLAPRQARQLAETARREADFCRRGGGSRVIQVLETAVVDDPASPELDGAVVLVLELAEHSLQDALDREPGRVPAQAERWAAEICEALADLHGAGWVHGDLKPANVLVMADGSLRLADFGLTSELEGTHGYAPPLGSPDYLPPERRTAPLTERGVPVRPSGDLWALGVTLHQLLAAGAMPFPGGTAAARTAAAHEYASGGAALRLDPALPEAWRPLVADCLTADPAERDRHDARTLATRARAAAGATPAAAARRRPALRWTAAAAAAVLAATGAWWGAVSGRPPHTGPTAQRPAPTGIAQVTVYNVEGDCRSQPQRLPACSMGLARDPHRPYETANVVAHRVWHGDMLTADCVLHDGEQVGDETGVETNRWFRVTVTDVPEKVAWLPAVRTHDNPPLPECAL